ncbi:carbohydrate ABC transporter permease [Anaerocolumna jejuensis]|uniref:carbohydrate ABC transporter permease n=1 Tax=Anaerocolumna jejuensis TaxID=259063 RepID=UPI003F7C541D
MNTGELQLQWKRIKEDKVLANRRKRTITKSRTLLFSVFKFIILLGISYIILGPIISIISNSFFSAQDVYNPAVFLFPFEPTLDNYKLSFLRLGYMSTLAWTILYVVLNTIIQLLITSMAGYGFARFDFPFKKLLFGCVIITIVIPTHTIMIPLYQHFRNFDIFGILQLTIGKKWNLLSGELPMYLMTLFGCGLRSGLYIYIFNQFFRGLPKEIEEAAFIDGAGMWYTYSRIMLVNAVPSLLTVTVFSLVWQYNDLFYVSLFSINSSHNLSLRLSTLQSTLQFLDKIKDPMLTQLNVYAGVVMVLIPILIIYLILQKYFMEGVERSGIVG